MTIDALRRAAEPKPLDVDVDPSVEDLHVIHAWRWSRFMTDNVTIGSDVDLLLKEVCAQRNEVRRLRSRLEAVDGHGDDAEGELGTGL